ncbi:hypothetical protein OHS58_17975 [Amycolatopsis sp. NBC_00348]|uniref:hypothetical protein n=1 Tax=Amycolatopsis sp. NBC_00348 TaxID=2975956 RepID=UPI002E26D42C
MPDYDRLTALLDKLVITLRNEPSPDADQRENLLSLRMISRELATRRERAFPAASGGALREFSLLLTQEYMRILIDQVAMWSGDNADSIHHALETAAATPFE